jgi:hypothetical protein
LTNPCPALIISGMINQVFAGIDPGATGGLGIVDHLGQCIATTRWDKANPARLYQVLQAYRPINTLIEIVAIFPRAGMGHAVMGQSLLVNAGIWRGFLIGLGLSWGEIHPSSWLARYALHHWQKKQKAGDTAQHSPLTLARELWPAAPLQYQADDGKAVGLLLAELARREYQLSSPACPQDRDTNAPAIAHGEITPPPTPRARVKKTPKPI